MLGADKGTSDRTDGSKLYIAIVQARFNEGITSALAQACKQELAALGVADRHIKHVLVPGALEVPVALQALASGALKPAAPRVQAFRDAAAAFQSLEGGAVPGKLVIQVA